MSVRRLARVEKLKAPSKAAPQDHLHISPTEMVSLYVFKLITFARPICRIWVDLGILVRSL